MNARSRHSPLSRGLLLLGGLLLGWSGCGQQDGADLEAAERQAMQEMRRSVKAGCEEATPALLRTNESMLPGRDCGGCHRAGGQATNSPFTVAGTIYTEVNTLCGGQAVAGAIVEIVDADGLVFTLRSNAAGNFFSSFKYVGPIRVRVYQGDPMAPTKEAKMATLVGRGVDPNGQPVNLPVACNNCHQLPGYDGAPGRVFLK